MESYILSMYGALIKGQRYLERFQFVHAKDEEPYYTTDEYKTIRDKVTSLSNELERLARQVESTKRSQEAVEFMVCDDDE